MSRNRYYHDEAVRASNKARYRIRRLADIELNDRVHPTNKNALGMKAWSELNGIDRKPFVASDKRAFSLRILLFCADHFDVSIDYLLGRTDKKEVNR